MIKWLIRGVVVLLALVMVLLAVVYMASGARLARSYDVPVAGITTATDSVTLALGRHVAEIRGCFDCHGEDLSGELFADAMPVLRVAGSNLTAGANGAGGRYTDRDWVRAIRSGVRPDGSALLIMPAEEFRSIGPEDLGALVSYLKSVPPVDSEPLEQAVGPLGRVLYLLGQAPLVPAELIDHLDATFVQPEVGATVGYGAYIASGCVGCHGRDYVGGAIPGMPPGTPWAANLTPDADTGLGSWTEDDFTSFLQDGIRPDGTPADPTMPRQLGPAMTNVERQALWMFLRSLPPTRRSDG